MSQLDRRGFLAAAGAALSFPAIARAAAIAPGGTSGTINDVEHVVILMQENRSFDHYFGQMPGVRGFGDRFPIPVPDAPGRTGKTVWTQANNTAKGGPPLISPFALNTSQDFALMRVEGTPHGWGDAQVAWNEGRMATWPAVKGEHAMGHFRPEDLPFQYALANAFTICDAYHCSIQCGTNSNRLFLWTGTNDGLGRAGGPSISNSHDHLVENATDSYTWKTYAERLLDAGISWKVYEDMADNFTDNPLAGFKTFRDSYYKRPGSDPRLTALGLSTQHLDVLKTDVLAGRLPKVSWIVSPAKDSEHPGPSSPAQGADYTARVLDALTANPDVWARTVLFVMFDENDGFFDHVPPPAPPSKDASGAELGGSTVDTTGEYYAGRAPTAANPAPDPLAGRPYGLGPRVPMYVISPWSRGGFVNSQVFDHTSVIRFLEKRFGVAEPNISAWRREVCGDLTSCFDFRRPFEAPAERLPETAAVAARAGALPGRKTPVTPPAPGVPIQAMSHRPSRPLPYVLTVTDRPERGAVALIFQNPGAAGAVFQVYDRRHLDCVPRRYTVGAGKSLTGMWDSGPYDFWVLGPGGFHRHFAGDPASDILAVAPSGMSRGRAFALGLRNTGKTPLTVSVTPGAYEEALKPWRVTLRPGATQNHSWPLVDTRGWYDLIVRVEGDARFYRRLAGRVESGENSTSDPAMGGPAVMDQPPR